MTELLRSGSLDKLSVGMLPDYSPEVAGFFQQVASSHLGEFSMRGLAADEELIFGGNHYEEGRILTIKDLTKVSHLMDLNMVYTVYAIICIRCTYSEYSLIHQTVLSAMFL